MDALLALNTSHFQARASAWLSFLELTLAREAITRQKETVERENAREIDSGDEKSESSAEEENDENDGGCVDAEQNEEDAKDVEGIAEVLAVRPGSAMMWPGE